VTQIAYGDQTIAFGYDAGTNGIGHLTSAGDANHALAWSYDPLGRVTAKTQTVGSGTSAVTKSVGYTYTNGDLTSLVTPSGQTVTYGYTHGQVTSIAVNGNSLLSQVLYQPFGPVSGWTWANNTNEARVYDEDGNVTNVEAAEGFTYSYDSAFRITGITDTDNSALSQSYGYDALDRPTGATGTNLNESWTYEANGNRLTQGGASSSTYTVAPSSNQLTSISGVLTRTYAYAASGRTTSYGGNTFTYLDSGRLSSVSNSGGTTGYIFNALGQRVKKSGTSVTLFVYDEAGHLLGEYDGSGNLIEETIWMGDVPVATLQPNGTGILVYYVHTDHLNTPRRITRPSDNAIVWRWDSEPFGTAAANQNPSGLGTFVYNLRFPGQYYDVETGLNYNAYRDYDPATGRYVQNDPIGLAGGINTYAYGGGNSVMRSDPSGLLYIPFTNIWIPAGEQYGAQAAQYWAEQQAQTGNPLYAIPGLLASLWTPCTSNKTGLALTSGGVLGAVTKGASFSNFFWNSESFSSISADYWGAEGADGMSLDHWMFSQASARAGLNSSGIVNAGFNLLEMPASLNTWLGFAPNWGGTQALLATLARLGIQVGVPATAGAAGAAGYALGSDANRRGCQ
jgi:RHS repeat-associated protein